MLSILLGKITKDAEKQNLLKIALLSGRQEAFDELLNHQELQEFYQKKVTTFNIGIWAAQGGNGLADLKLC